MLVSRGMTSAKTGWRWRSAEAKAARQFRAAGHNKYHIDFRCQSKQSSTINAGFGAARLFSRSKQQAWGPAPSADCGAQLVSKENKDGRSWADATDKPPPELHSWPLPGHHDVEDDATDFETSAHVAHSYDVNEECSLLLDHFSSTTTSPTTLILENLLQPGGAMKPVQPGDLGTPCARTHGVLPVQPGDLGTPTSWTHGSVVKPVQPGDLGTPCAWTFGMLPVQPSDLGTPTPWTHGSVGESSQNHPIQSVVESLAKRITVLEASSGVDSLESFEKRLAALESSTVDGINDRSCVLSAAHGGPGSALCPTDLLGTRVEALETSIANTVRALCQLQSSMAEKVSADNLKLAFDMFSEQILSASTSSTQQMLDRMLPLEKSSALTTSLFARVEDAEGRIDALEHANCTYGGSETLKTGGESVQDLYGHARSGFLDEMAALGGLSRNELSQTVFGNNEMKFNNACTTPTQLRRATVLPVGSLEAQTGALSEETESEECFEPELEEGTAEWGPSSAVSSSSLGLRIASGSVFGHKSPQ